MYDGIARSGGRAWSRVAFGSGLGVAVTMALTVSTAAGGLENKVEVTIDGEVRTIGYWPHSVRAHEFRVRSQVDDGSLVEAAIQEPKTIRGLIDGLPGAVVAGSVLDDGLHAAVYMPDGRVLWYAPDQGQTADVVSAGVAEVGPADSILAAPGMSPHRDGHAGNDTMMLGIDCQVAQIAFDADFEMYQLHGSSEQQVVDRIEAILNAVNVQFENEVGIIHEITEIIVRTSPAQNPYTSTNNFGLLNQFRFIWNTPPENDIVRDVAHLYTGKALDGGLTGAAFLGVVCNLPNAYGLVRDQSIDFACITDRTARMLGANWGAMICECEATTMDWVASCANTFIGPGSDSVDLILAYKNSVDCLDPCVPKCGPGDLNCDGTVGVEDLLILLASWGPCADCDDCPADLDRDCAVGVSDLLILLANWG